MLISLSSTSVITISSSSKFDSCSATSILSILSDTRAGIIENLIHKDLIRRDKKNLLVTEKGNRLVSIVEDKFKSAETTSEWEMKLAKISSGEVDKEDFLREIEDSIRELVDRYKNNLNE